MSKWAKFETLPTCECEFGVPVPLGGGTGQWRACYPSLAHPYEQPCGEPATQRVWWQEDQSDFLFVCEAHARYIENSEEYGCEHPSSSLIETRDGDFFCYECDQEAIKSAEAFEESRREQEAMEKAKATSYADADKAAQSADRVPPNGEQEDY